MACRGAIAVRWSVMLSRRSGLLTIAALFVACDRSRKQKNRPSSKYVESPDHEIVHRYEKTAGAEWAFVVVDEGTSTKDLERLAKHLHESEPKVSFRIFDQHNKKKIRAYVDWDRNY